MAGSSREGSVENGVRRTGRRLLVLVTALVIATVGVPTVATAGPPTTQTERGTDISCESLDGFLNIFVHEGEDHAFLDVFFEPVEDGLFLFGGTEEFDFDGTNLSAEVEMFLEEHHEENGENGNGEPELVGTAFISATLEPIGEPETFEDRFRDGNRWVTVRETSQEVAVSGSAVLEGFFDVDLSVCFGNLFENEFSSTNPNSFVGRFEARFLGCELDVPDGFGFVFAESFDDGTFVDVFIESGEGALFGFTEDATFTDTELSAVVDLFEESEGEGDDENGNGEPVAQAIVEATLESTGFITNEIIFQNGRVKSRVETFDVTGSVAVNGSEFEMIACDAESFSDRVNIRDPNGPKPSGPTPDNDVPEGAESLEARGTTNSQNKAAASAPEVECIFIDDHEENGENGHEPEEFPVPFGKTLWYSFEGTGGPVIIDSAGSNFDTVMGVYDVDLNQIVCVDDVGDESGGFSLQAAATVETELGMTYLVQIGGFGFFPDPEFPSEAEIGRIRLNLS